MSAIAMTIKNLRTSNNWTQLYVADKIGTSKYVISNWERGVANPDLEQLIKLSDLFTVSTDYLVGIDKDIKNISDIPATNQNSIDLLKLLNSGTTITFKNNTLNTQDIEAITAITEVLFDGIYPNS